MASPLGPGGPFDPGGRGGRPRRRRAPLRWRLVFAALLLIPIAEVAVIIAVGRVIGGWPTLGLLVALSALGAYVIRHQGSRAWAGLLSALTTGRMPARELADAALVLVGGTLLLAPGFITDVVGFFFILPFTRPLTRRWLQAAVQKRLLRWGPGGRGGPGDGGGTIRGEVL